MAEKYQRLSEYLTLVDWMRSTWGGNLSRGFDQQYSELGWGMNIGGMLAGVPPSVGSDIESENIFELDFYPALETSVEGHPLRMMLSETNLLVLSIECDIRCIFLVRHEKWIDKIYKRIWIEFEFQTGDSTFDRQYYIVANDPSHRAVFLDGTFRERLREMEPLAQVEASRSRLEIIRPIQDASLLQADSVKDIIRRMLDMADYLKDRHC